MPIAPQTPAEIIDALGGHSELARKLTALTNDPDKAVTRQVVHFWPITGIPPKFYEAVQALLEAEGHPRAPLAAFPKMLPPPVLTDEGVRA